MGQLAPFFLKRVFNLEIHGRIPVSPLKRWVQLLAKPGKEVFRKLYGDSAFIEMQVCAVCSFVQAKRPFCDEAIMQLYLDYRTESYNAERIQYEPTYQAIAHRIGIDDIEVRARVDAATEWLADKVQVGKDFTMLDYGGADGRFLPRWVAEKFVYEVSEATPIEGITRIPNEAGLGSYSYIQLAQVLEHVVYPLRLVEQVARHIKPGGYLYIEVPQEMADAQLRSLQDGSYPFNIPVHEHINLYSLSAIAHLLEQANLEVVASRADPVDLGWVKSVNIRALGRRGW